jgi:hypothetical protein
MASFSKKHLGFSLCFTRREGNKVENLWACEDHRLNSTLMNFRVTPGFLVDLVQKNTYVNYGIKYGTTSAILKRSIPILRHLVASSSVSARITCGRQRHPIVKKVLNILGQSGSITGYLSVASTWAAPWAIPVLTFLGATRSPADT